MKRRSGGHPSEAKHTRELADKQPPLVPNFRGDGESHGDGIMVRLVQCMFRPDGTSAKKLFALVNSRLGIAP